MNILNKLFTRVDFNSTKTRSRFTILLICIFFLILFTLIALLPENNSKPTPNETLQKNDQLKIIKSSENGDTILYEDNLGNQIIESSDPTMTKERAMQKLKLDPNQNVEFTIPGAMLPRAFTDEEIKDFAEPTPFDDQTLLDEFGLDPNFID